MQRYQLFGPQEKGEVGTVYLCFGFNNHQVGIIFLLFMKGSSRVCAKRKDEFVQRTLTYFVRGNITVRLTSCLTGLDSAVLLN